MVPGSGVLRPACQNRRRQSRKTRGGACVDAYRNPALREFHDLDLKVRSEDDLRVRDVLIGDGYSLWSPVIRHTDAERVRSSNR